MQYEKKDKIKNKSGKTDTHLVTLVERKSSLTLIKKMPDKTSESVLPAMISLLSRVSDVKTITLNNGGEFAKHGILSQSIHAAIYFAKPYANYQRGTNENTNGIIRKTLAKKNGHKYFDK